VMLRRLAGDFCACQLFGAECRRNHGLMLKNMPQTATFLISWLIKRQYH
jgi:hypothetical protein